MRSRRKISRSKSDIRTLRDGLYTTPDVSHKDRKQQKHLFRREALEEEEIDFFFWCWWKWLGLDPRKYPDKYPLWYRENQDDYYGEW